MRVSTAGEPNERFFEYLLSLADGDLLINIGAGRTASATRRLINVDLVPTASEVPVVAGDATALPVVTRGVDGVILKDVLEHLAEPISALAEARRVVRPGGTAVIVTPRAIPRAVWADPTHIRGFTARAIMQALDLSGWQLVRKPQRIGGIPGIGRLPGAIPLLPTILAVPGLGHWYGKHWLVRAVAR